MLRTNTALWRIAFLSGLGILPAACSGSAAGSSGNTGTHRALTPTACTDPEPYLWEGMESGLERCGDGRVHRTAAVACNSKLPRQSTTEPRDLTASCSADGECTAQPHGYCGPAPFDTGPFLTKDCHYGCLTDAECGPGYLCQCGDPVGACVPASCRTDADCGEGLLCAMGSRNKDACTIQHEFACETLQDECRICEARDKSLMCCIP